MSRETWNTIKSSKNFYVHTYRKAGSFLLLSITLNLIFGVLFYFLYFSQPEPDYYATSGVTSPVKLTRLDSPNKTSVPLLASEPENDEPPKVIPQ